jgi:hypothetical protein
VLTAKIKKDRRFGAGEHQTFCFINGSNFALAKHTPPFEATPMRIVYNAFSYLEGVIIQGMISGFLYSRV